MSTFDFGDLAPWFGGGKEAAEEPEFDAWKPQRDAFDGFLAANKKAFDAFEGGDVFEGDGTHDALDPARALLPDQPVLRDAFERDVGRLRESFAPAPAEPARPLEDLLARYAAIPARAPDQAAWVQRRADRLVGTAERLNLVDTKTADALMNRFGADASEHLALGTARRGGVKPVLDALADRALFPDLKGGRRKRLRSRLQARLLGEADDRARGRERAGSKERRDKLSAAYARAAEFAALADRPAAEIEDAAAATAITPGLRRLLRGRIERNRAEAKRDAERIARVEAALDAGAPLDRDDPEDRAAADAHYEAVAPVWRGLAPKARLALILPYVQSLGLLPKGLVRRLDAALRGTLQDKHAAAGLIGAIARDVPGALADLRPGAVVQAAAINALGELGYSPERAVGRATQIVAGNGDKPGLNDDDDCGAIVEHLQAIVDRLAAPQTEVDGEAVQTALAPGASGAFANALRQPVRSRAFNASAAPIPIPGPLGALIAALTLMMILIEEQRRRNRPLPAEPPPDDAPEQERERERGQSAPAAPSDATNESPDDVEAPTPEQSIRRLRRPTDPCRGLRRQVREHERKAREYEQDPYAHDNDGILATRPRELHPAIIAGRLSKLRRQIENFRRLLQRCERQHDS